MPYKLHVNNYSIIKSNNSITDSPISLLNVVTENNKRRHFSEIEQLPLLEPSHLSKLPRTSEPSPFLNFTAIQSSVLDKTNESFMLFLIFSKCSS